jgi:filamentous hemagglutinin family protein
MLHCLDWITTDRTLDSDKNTLALAQENSAMSVRWWLWGKRWFGIALPSVGCTSCHVASAYMMFISSTLLVSSGNCALAQNITLDGTLGPAQMLTGPNYIIPQAVGQTVGSNLFHSFGQFNLNTGESAGFQSAANIRNILSRVTGASASLIDGQIFTESPSVNLFLMNPNGIVFGANASLNVGSATRGSFVATTANAIQLGARGAFVASTSQRDVALLTVEPSAFLFNQIAAGAITSQAQLEVNKGQSLLLIGGDVSLNGGRLKAPEGRIELGGIAGVGVLELSVNGNTLGVSFPNSLALANVSLTNKARVDTSGEGGGTIQVHGNRVTLTNESRIFADTLGSRDGQGIFIQASQLILQDGARVSASTSGSGKGGSIEVNASDLVELIGASAEGRPSALATDNQEAIGDGGAVIINTRQLIVRGGRISASTSGSGKGGSIEVNASDLVELIGTVPNREPGTERSSGLSVQTRGTGEARDLTINTRRLIVRDGAEVSASTFGEGRGGTVAVNADSVELIGISVENSQLRSRLVAEAGKFREATASQAGELPSPAEMRMGGNVIIKTRQLIVRDGAEVTVSSAEAIGNAGFLSLEADLLFLDQEGKLRGDTASGLGGNIILQVRDLILIRNGSAIATTAANNGSGGNITIQAPFIVAVPSENSDLIANADQGFGGRIDITATGIYGLAFRDDLTVESDINASSNATGRDGIVEINTLDVDHSRALVHLSTETIDASNQIQQICPTGGQVVQNEFIITGRGGLPDNPHHTLSTDAVWADLRPIPQTVETRNHSHNATVSTNAKTAPLVEAQGWIMNDKGQVVLTASASTVTPQNLRLSSTQCHVPQM